MTAPEIAALRGLYGRTSAERIAELVDAADALAAGLQTLRHAPTPDGAERIATQLHAMYRSARALVDELAREVAE
jgi:uncharacterized protein (DUF2267 family)